MVVRNHIGRRVQHGTVKLERILGKGRMNEVIALVIAWAPIAAIAATAFSGAVMAFFFEERLALL